MDLIIVIMGIAFVALIAAGFFLFSKESQPLPQKSNASKNPEADIVGGLRKRISSDEEKMKNLEYTLEATRLELAQMKEKEKTLLNEKSKEAFDSQQYEKSKKEHQLLKEELTRKEENLENEISLRRQQGTELTQLKAESDGLKKRVMEAEDTFRKAQTTIETLTKELAIVKRTFQEQQRIVQEHTENKIGGEWVSREELNKVEKELKEKEVLIQKYLSLKKNLQT
jgi:chromosome segregation ATPase